MLSPPTDSAAPVPRPEPTGLRIAAPLQAQVTERLNAFRLQTAPPPPPGTRRAAVALVLLDEGPGADVPGLPNPPSRSDQAALLLTRRAAHLHRHAGQWALPGGRMEPDETAEQAALRELHEEVGLPASAVQVLGRLDDYATRSGFVITPVVVWAGSVRALAPDANEVASVHRIPLTEFLRADAPLLDPSLHSPHPVLRMPLGTSWIAAPTAAFMYQFREVCLAGRETRVAHFDQPAFAWR